MIGIEMIGGFSLAHHHRRGALPPEPRPPPPPPEGWPPPPPPLRDGWLLGRAPLEGRGALIAGVELRGGLDCKLERPRCDWVRTSDPCPYPPNAGGVRGWTVVPPRCTGGTWRVIGWRVDGVVEGCRVTGCRVVGAPEGGRVTGWRVEGVPEGCLVTG